MWSHDDSELFYLRVEERINVYAKKLASDSDPSLVVEDGSPCDTSPDGRYLLFRRDRFDESGEQGDLWIRDLADSTDRPWLATPFSERAGRFSPAGSRFGPAGPRGHR